MFKKIYQIIFILLFSAVLLVPAVMTDWSSGGVSEDENRNLEEFPSLVADGGFNEKFTSGFESWFMDHMGLRQDLITMNATLQYKVFDRMLTTSNYLLGRDGDINYATQEMKRDYAHLNLRTEEEVAKIGESYQAVSDWLGKQGIPFYYVQCFDKHSIYPEQFTNKIYQHGDISKTDQVITYLKENTTVNTISMKDALLPAKEKYEVFSNWGDPTHWSERGAYVGYQYLMERVAADFADVSILQEEDYDITMKNIGITLNKVIHQDDIVESFAIKAPSAQKSDTAVLGQWSSDDRHSVWVNPEAGNDLKLLLMCDSYIESFIAEDLAEGFSEVWMVWGDYTQDLPEIIELYDPDLVIYECAERVDRSGSVCALAESLKQ